MSNQGFNDNNGDGLLGPLAAFPYNWTVSAEVPVGQPISFVGSPNFRVTGTMALTWQIQQAATDGSVPQLQYSIDSGATFTTVTIGSGNTPQSGINESGLVSVTLSGSSGLIVNVLANGGTPSLTAKPWAVALAITRNNLETLKSDTPNPFNPLAYNPQRFDGVTPNGSYPAQTLAQLRTRIMIGLGFSNQAANPPPGMAAFVNDKLFSAQNMLYRLYAALHTRHFFRWKLIAGQRFYSLLDNDEDVLAGYRIDPAKKIEWAGIQDTRNVWYPLIEGIPPQLYTMITKPWRPARYDIRGSLEVYPAPDQTYFLWMRANFGLLSFVNDSDPTTIDSELVYLHALALAKAHYGQPDASNIQALANTYRAQLIAGTHGTSHYIPGTIAVPPAVRPTLIQYQDNQGG